MNSLFILFFSQGKEGYLQSRDQMLRRTSYAGEACSRPPTYHPGEWPLTAKFLLRLNKLFRQLSVWCCLWCVWRSIFNGVILILVDSIFACHFANSVTFWWSNLWADGDSMIWPILFFLLIDRCYSPSTCSSSNWGDSYLYSFSYSFSDRFLCVCWNRV